MVKHTGSALLLLLALALTGCGSDSGDTNATSDSGNSAKATEDSSSDSSPDAAPSEPEPSGTLAREPVPCKKLAAPVGFKPAGAGPPVMCAFESADARVTISVGPGPRSFDQLKQVEEINAQSKGVTPPAIEQVDVDGWTVAVRWPEVGGFNQLDRHLADATGIVLTCKVGVQGGPVDATTHADFCDGARELLYTP